MYYNSSKTIDFLSIKYSTDGLKTQLFNEPLHARMDNSIAWRHLPYRMSMQFENHFPHFPRIALIANLPLW